MGRLGLGRHRRLSGDRRVAGAVSQREDIAVPRGLQRGGDHQLIQPVAFQSVQVGQHVRAADSRGLYGDIAGHDLLLVAIR